MTLEQVETFYKVLISDQTIYEQYCNQCCRRGFFGSYHWNKTKIINFATNLGFKFTEYELEKLWFESAPSFVNEPLSLSVQR
ncbi:hypothetical protein NIES3585_36000 [Nodularia sp. NIES-3585]|nr:hypothetical protein [Nodularia sp. NIES-3585]GAX37555.1 hypothetical protein NIES3585_36000 [Nodularia sp. NIES-3585]